MEYVRAVRKPVCSGVHGPGLSVFGIPIVEHGDEIARKLDAKNKPET